MYLVKELQTNGAIGTPQFDKVTNITKIKTNKYLP